VVARADGELSGGCGAARGTRWRPSRHSSRPLR
jgi:hypothetical protein